MIPKAVIHAVAKEESLRDTTIEQNYVLGWMLRGVAAHPRLYGWVFNGFGADSRTAWMSSGSFAVVARTRSSHPDLCALQATYVATPQPSFASGRAGPSNKAYLRPAASDSVGMIQRFDLIARRTCERAESDAGSRVRIELSERAVCSHPRHTFIDAFAQSVRTGFVEHGPQKPSFSAEK